jgi:serine/threonine-protein kinase
MGLRDWLGRVFGKGASDDRASSPPAVPTTNPVRNTAPGTKGLRQQSDPLEELKRLPRHEAVGRAIEMLDSAEGATAAAAIVSWLRDASAAEELPPDVRVQLADFFAARGEPDPAVRALRPLTDRGDAAAAAALVRLADFAEERGAVDEACGLLEEVLAIDLEYPGVRARVKRMRAPARAGGAGATLLSPESTKLAEGRLRLVRELGRGGAGAVFLAHDARLERQVALKIYHPAKRADRGARLRAEAQVAAAISSRHVVRVFDLFEDLGAVSMEYCEGGSLRNAITRGGAALDARRQWARGVAHALAIAHEKGWVHRDLKPGNVLLRIDGAPVLTDFGLARRAGSAIEPFEGTAGYVPPEVKAGALADPRMDVFAFGALVNELLGDDPVFAALGAAARSLDPSQRPRDGAALLRVFDGAGVVGQ